MSGFFLLLGLANQLALVKFVVFVFSTHGLWEQTARAARPRAGSVTSLCPRVSWECSRLVSECGQEGTPAGVLLGRPETLPPGPTVTSRTRSRSRGSRLSHCPKGQGSMLGGEGCG